MKTLHTDVATDLVGEEIEIWRRPYSHYDRGAEYRVAHRGVVRAAYNSNGNFVFLLATTREADAKSEPFRLGDIWVVPLDDGGGGYFVRVLAK